MSAGKSVKSMQEQAVASWINYVNQQRINELLCELLQRDIHLDNALKELAELKKSIHKLIQSNRGGINGMHGFIAERIQVYFENARNLLEGADRTYVLVDDNSSVDYIGNGINYQLKFVEKYLSLGAVKKHLDKYPDFIKKGSKYHIPNNYYKKMKYLYELPESEAKKLIRDDYRLWKYIRNFFKEENINFNDIEPAVVGYGDVQQNVVDKTILEEEKYIRNHDKEKRERLYQESRPSEKEATRVAVVSALEEGSIAFCMGVYRKRKAGKKLFEFVEDDWRELGIDAAKSGTKGCVRGAVIYGMTNFTATPAAVASGLVTAAFGVLTEASRLKAGAISQEDFFINSEVFCLDAAVSAVSSVLGEVLIPVPVLGAVIGNLAGMFLYGIAQNAMSEEEQKVIQQYRCEELELEKTLDKQYCIIMGQIEEEMGKFDSLIEWAFSEKANASFEGSVKLAEHCGVRGEKILRDRCDIEYYFLA